MSYTDFRSPLHSSLGPDHVPLPLRRAHHLTRHLEVLRTWKSDVEGQSLSEDPRVIHSTSETVRPAFSGRGRPPWINSSLLYLVEPNFVVEENRWCFPIPTRDLRRTGSAVGGQQGRRETKLYNFPSPYSTTRNIVESFSECRSGTITKSPTRSRLLWLQNSERRVGLVDVNPPTKYNPFLSKKFPWDTDFFSNSCSRIRL